MRCHWVCSLQHQGSKSRRGVTLPVPWHAQLYWPCLSSLLACRCCVLGTSQAQRCHNNAIRVDAGCMPWRQVYKRQQTHMSHSSGQKPPAATYICPHCCSHPHNNPHPWSKLRLVADTYLQQPACMSISHSSMQLSWQTATSHMDFDLMAA